MISHHRSSHWLNSHCFFFWEMHHILLQEQRVTSPPNLFHAWTKSWELRDLEAHSLRTCQHIWKSQASLKHKVLGWLMIHQGLAVKTRLLKVGVTNAACKLCSKNAMIEHVFQRCLSANTFCHFGHGFNFHAEFTIFSLPCFLGKALSLGHLDN